MSAIIMPTTVLASSAGDQRPVWRAPLTLSHVLSATTSCALGPTRQLMTRAAMLCRPAGDGFEMLEARPGVLEIMPSPYEHEFLVAAGSEWLHFRALAVPRTWSLPLSPMHWRENVARDYA